MFPASGFSGFAPSTTWYTVPSAVETQLFNFWATYMIGLTLRESFPLNRRVEGYHS
jgi:hypothetical protein